MTRCPTCHGVAGVACNTCDGTGEVDEPKGEKIAEVTYVVAQSVGAALLLVKWGEAIHFDTCPKAVAAAARIFAMDQDSKDRSGLVTQTLSVFKVTVQVETVAEGGT